eukprot:2881549-Prymnesium_polylepis.1
MTRGMSALLRLIWIFSLRPDLRRVASACSRSETILIAWSVLSCLKKPNNWSASWLAAEPLGRPG